MHISGWGKTIDISAIGYEDSGSTPVRGDGYDYSANWILIEVSYSDGVFQESQRRPWLQTYELATMADGLENVLGGVSDCYLSDFLEPNLRIAFVRCADGLVVAVQYDPENSKNGLDYWTVSAKMNHGEGAELLDDLRQMQANYPER